MLQFPRVYHTCPHLLPQSGRQTSNFPSLSGLGLTGNLLRASHPQTSRSPYSDGWLLFLTRSTTTFLGTSVLGGQLKKERPERMETMEAALRTPVLLFQLPTLLHNYLTKDFIGSFRTKQQPTTKEIKIASPCKVILFLF